MSHLSSCVQGQIVCTVTKDHHDHYCRGCGSVTVFRKGPFATDLEGNSTRISVGRCGL